MREAESSIKAAERGTKLTGQLLTFSRSQKLELKPMLIEGMSALFRRTLGPLLRIRLNLAIVAVPVMANAMQLELAVLNLAINARDAMPTGGESVISTKCHVVETAQDLKAGEYLEIRMSDKPRHAFGYRHGQHEARSRKPGLGGDTRLVD